MVQSQLISSPSSSRQYNSLSYPPLISLASELNMASFITNQNPCSLSSPIHFWTSIKINLFLCPTHPFISTGKIFFLITFIYYKIIIFSHLKEKTKYKNFHTKVFDIAVYFVSPKFLN